MLNRKLIFIILRYALLCFFNVFIHSKTIAFLI
ncbi:hypothetical protein CoNPh17_CDS0239 [Staphylococcus phage S-CoN_Ph17]|nr:hypothetical protein CoNPh17_CDS0239 [Staphylococcus phage S-CoN_Ph17]